MALTLSADGTRPVLMAGALRDEPAFVLAGARGAGAAHAAAAGGGRWAVNAGFCCGCRCRCWRPGAILSCRLKILPHGAAVAMALWRRGRRWRRLDGVFAGWKRHVATGTLDEQLPTGWRVSRLTAGELDIVTPPDVNRQRGAGNVKENKMMRWISLLLLLLPLAVVAARNDKPVSLVVDDAPVAQCCKPAEMNHKNLVVAPDVSGTLSLRLQKVPGPVRCGQWRIAQASLQQQGTVIYAHTQARQKPIWRSAKLNRRNVCRTCRCWRRA